jgi:phage shock protein C
MPEVDGHVEPHLEDGGDHRHGSPLNCFWGLATVGSPHGCPNAGRLREGGAMDPSEKLYRSRTNRQVAGVCGGLAQRFNVDATLIRVLFILLGLFGGAGIVLYIAMWIIVPQEALRAAPHRGYPPAGLFSTMIDRGRA